MSDMKGNSIVCLCASLFFLFSACAGEERKLDAKSSENNYKIEVPVDEYKDWVNDKDHLVYHKEMEKYSFELKYLPIEVITLREFVGSTIDTSLYQTKLKEREGLHYMVLKIKMLKGEDILMENMQKVGGYDNVVKYFSFDIQRDFSLIDGNDTLPCVLLNLERTYQVSPYLTIMMGFERKDNEVRELKFLYNDYVLGVGPIKINIPKEQLENVPQPII